MVLIWRRDYSKIEVFWKEKFSFEYTNFYVSNKNLLNIQNFFYEFESPYDFNSYFENLSSVATHT